MNSKKLYITLLLSMVIMVSHAQKSTNTSGNNAFGSGGTVVYSIGQVVYTAQSGSNGSVNQGVQQPYEIYMVGAKEENINISLTLFPNPTSDYFTLKFKDYNNEKMIYQLMDLQGKLIHNGKIIGNQTIIKLSSYPKGSYFIKVSQESKEIKTFRIIKN